MSGEWQKPGGIHCVEYPGDRRGESSDSYSGARLPAFKSQLCTNSDFRDFLMCLSVKRIKLFPPLK